MMSQSAYTNIPWLSNTNTLLVKDDVGRAKPSTYDLPHQRFIYGKPLGRDPETAKEVTMIWKFHNETRDQTAESDFRKLNKLSVRSGLYTSKGYSEFRRSTEAPLYVYKGQNQNNIMIPDNDFTYGMSNRPSTPIKNVMGNMYGLQSEVALSEIYTSRMDQYSRKIKYRPKSNKSTYLNKLTVQTKLQQMKQKDSKNLFKLKKFTSVGPRTNTYSRNGAFSQKSQIINAAENKKGIENATAAVDQRVEALENPAVE